MAAINEGGHPVGVDIAINDNDLGAGPLKQQLHWAGVNDLFWRNCHFFGTLILLSKQPRGRANPSSQDPARGLSSVFGAH
jgi:hypothetical protein